MEGGEDTGETDLGPNTHHPWITWRRLLGVEVMLSNECSLSPHGQRLFIRKESY